VNELLEAIREQRPLSLLVNRLSAREFERVAAYLQFRAAA